MIQLLFVFNDWALFALRIVLAAVFIAHGWPKLKDLKKTGAGFEKMGFRPGSFWGFLATLIEFFGGILLLIGFLTQIIASVLALHMLVAVLWHIRKKHTFTSGYELALLLVVALFVLATTGSSIFSFDAFVPLFLF